MEITFTHLFTDGRKNNHKVIADGKTYLKEGLKWTNLTDGSSVDHDMIQALESHLIKSLIQSNES